MAERDFLPHGFADPQAVARMLGGEAFGNRVVAPGPGHSALDRSLSILVEPSAPDGFLVTSHAGDDPLACKDYVRNRAGLERPFLPLRRPLTAVRTSPAVAPGGRT